MEMIKSIQMIFYFSPNIFSTKNNYTSDKRNSLFMREFFVIVNLSKSVLEKYYIIWYNNSLQDFYRRRGLAK